MEKDWQHISFSGLLACLRCRTPLASNEASSKNGHSQRLASPTNSNIQMKKSNFKRYSSGKTRSSKGNSHRRNKLNKLQGRLNIHSINCVSLHYGNHDTGAKVQQMCEYIKVNNVDILCIQSTKSKRAKYKTAKYSKVPNIRNNQIHNS